MKKKADKIIKVQTKKLLIPQGQRVFVLDYLGQSTTLSKLSSVSILIGAGAEVDYLLLVDPQVSFDFSIQREIHLAPGAHLHSQQIYFARSNYQVQINNYLETEAVLDNQVLCWQQKKQSLRVQDNYIFQGLGATSQSQVDSLVDNQASVQYYSDLIIKASAQLSVAQIAMNLSLLAPQATGQLLPSLQIAANDVQAGHRASTFNLSPEDLFYLQNRGLNPREIKNLLISSLTKKVISRISVPNIQELVSNLINKRLP